MVFGSAIPPSAVADIKDVGKADIVIGIPSYNNAATIGHVVRTAAAGVTHFFPDMQSLILNSDGGSKDSTRNVIMSEAIPKEVQRLTFEYRGLPGKGSAVRAILEVADRLGAKAVVLLDSDLRSITPEWLDRLAGPVVRQGYEFIAPYYTRHKYDGTITNNIAYPMTRALYGYDVRQPIGGDFCLSGHLARSCVKQDVWATDVARFGIDIFLTTTAIAKGAKVGQAALGLKVHDPRDPAASLGPMFTQVVGTLFSLMARYESLWRGVEKVGQAPILGQVAAGEPEPVKVSLSALIERLRTGAAEHGQTWRAVITPDNLARLREVQEQPPERFAFPSDLWVRIVYDFAAAFRRIADGSQDTLLQALMPLYFGRTAGFVIETKDMDSAQAEDLIAAQADTFVALKPYLLRRIEA